MSEKQCVEGRTLKAGKPDTTEWFKLSGDVNNGAVDSLPQPHARGISLQDEGFPTESRLYLLKCYLTLLLSLGHIWGSLLKSVKDLVSSVNFRMNWPTSRTASPHFWSWYAAGCNSCCFVCLGMLLPSDNLHYCTSLHPSAHSFGLAVSRACIRTMATYCICSAQVSLWMITS